MPLLELRKLTKKFGGLTAVDGVDLAVEPGQIVGLIGPNGAGKSTIFNLICGAFPPTSGRVIFRGKDITGLKPHAVVRHGLARCFQHTVLFGEMTVLENILMGFYLRSRVSFWKAVFGTVSRNACQDDVLREAVDIADFSGLGDKLREMAKNLPHGHQRALGVAVALATGADLLLLDEPATGMNPEETVQMMHRIRAIRERGVSVLLVEHDMKLVMGVCDTIHVLNFGKKIAEGCPEEICRHEDVIAAYLGKDYAVGCQEH